MPLALPDNLKNVYMHKCYPVDNFSACLCKIHTAKAIEFTQLKQ